MGEITTDLLARSKRRALLHRYASILDIALSTDKTVVHVHSYWSAHSSKCVGVMRP